MLTSHQDRVAVVTGAGRGIGQAVCRQLAERGATVVAVDLTEPDESLAQLDSTGHKATGLVADVSDPGQTRAVGEEVRRRHGRCDILVNNAGINPASDTGRLASAAGRPLTAIHRRPAQARPNPLNGT